MGWLDSYHTFSFGSFNDPARMGFGNLRVINEDTIIPGSGFSTHRHDNMDIMTLVRSGRLRHEDDQGNMSIIGPGEVQLMSAGTGVEHSEWNASDDETAQFFQIWMIPDTLNGPPDYAQAQVAEGPSVHLAGKGGLVPLRSESSIHLRRASDDEEWTIGDDGADQFIHLMDGLAHADEERVSAGDGLQIPAGHSATLTWSTPGQALIFHMPRKTKDALS